MAIQVYLVPLFSIVGLHFSSAADGTLHDASSARPLAALVCILHLQGLDISVFPRLTWQIVTTSFMAVVVR